MTFIKRKGRTTFSVGKRGPRMSYRLGCAMPILALLLVALLLAGCGGSSATPEATPVPDRYTDAEQTELLFESIEIVHGSEPQPAWYPAFVDLHVEDGWANVVTADASVAEAMCAAIAAVTFDDDAQPIGVRAVMVFGPTGDVLTDCDVPEG